MAAAILGCGGRSLPPTPPTLVAAVTYENAKYGYAVGLPAGWRFSPRVSYDDYCASVGAILLPGEACPMPGIAVITTRSVDEEAALIAATHIDVGPASFLSYIVRVSVLANADRLTPLQWARQSGRGYEPAKAVPTTVQGREAARMNESVFVGRDDLMFQIEYVLGPALSPEWIPHGWTVAQIEQAQQQIVASFRFTR